jgi:hypothetical protein
MNLIQNSLQTIIPLKRKATSGGWISFNAPCCVHRGESKDERLRGGVLFTEEGFVYSCFNCGFKAGWKPGKALSKNSKSLFSWLGFPDTEIAKLILEALKEKDSILPETKEFSFELHEEPLPDNCQCIKYWAQLDNAPDELLNVINYITDRGFTLDDYNWHWSNSNGYKDRVILPFYQNQKVVGWTGRKISAGFPKYLTKSQRGYVFNIDAQTYDREFVIVVEGQFDAIAIGGIAIMTNEPNDIQCARINALGKKVIVVPDRDRPGAKMLEAAIQNGWSMSLPPWGEDIKDVADAVKKYGKVYTLTTILHYQEQNKIKINLQKIKLEKLDDK